jgi:hypothetical protein
MGKRLIIGNGEKDVRLIGGAEARCLAEQKQQKEEDRFHGWLEYSPNRLP